MTNAKGWQFDIKSCGAYFHHDQHKNFRETSDISGLNAMISLTLATKRFKVEMHPFADFREKN